MRISGGILRGRLLKTIKGGNLRPTSDKVRQAVFNILGSERIKSASVLDLFAGTGAYGIEALSRGAERVCFVERKRRLCLIIRENIRNLGIEERCRIVNSDAFDVIRGFSDEREHFSLIFADPPYRRDLVKKLIELIDRSKILDKDGIVVVEHSKDELPEEEYEGLRRFIFKRYGDTCISIYKGK